MWGAFLFDYFILGKQNKVTRLKAKSNIQNTKWIPAFAGITEQVKFLVIK